MYDCWTRREKINLDNENEPSKSDTYHVTLNLYTLPTGLGISQFGKTCPPTDPIRVFIYARESRLGAKGSRTV